MIMEGKLIIDEWFVREAEADMVKKYQSLLIAKFFMKDFKRAMIIMRRAVVNKCDNLVIFVIYLTETVEGSKIEKGGSSNVMGIIYPLVGSAKNWRVGVPVLSPVA